MLIDKTGIRSRIPHAGAMCLLDAVLSWDDRRIVCTATSHHASDNPLRRNGRLHAVCGIEYAAQAMALHATLASGERGQPRMGYLASLRNLFCRATYLDVLEGDLVASAELLLDQGSHAIYQFTLSSQNEEMISGRAAVALEPRAPDGPTQEQ